MSTGLNQRELALLTGVLSRSSRLERAILFGSRAKGIARRGADVDIAVEGLSGGLELARLAQELDDLPLPYRFDVVALESIRDTAVREHIARVGVTLFERLPADQETAPAETQAAGSPKTDLNARRPDRPA